MLKTLKSDFLFKHIVDSEITDKNAKYVLDFMENVLNKAREVYQNLGKEIPKEAPKNAIFGSYAFPDLRPYDVAAGEIDLEDDTTSEKQFEKDFKNHFDNSHPLSSDEAAILKRLVKKGYYNKVFHWTDASIVYRGLAVSKSWMAKALKLKANETIPDEGTLDVPIQYKPRTGATSSWSTDPFVAKDFANEHTSVSEFPYLILLEADPATNAQKFLAGDGGLYRLDITRDYRSEHEVLALGTIKVNKLTWLKYHGGRRPWQKPPVAEKNK